MIYANANAGACFGGTRTGNYKARQRSFDVNEMVACLGILRVQSDAQRFIYPLEKGTISEERMEKEKWGCLEKQSMRVLTETPAILVSDDVHFTAGISVPPVPQTLMPSFASAPWVTQPPGFAWSAQPLYIQQMQNVSYDGAAGVGGAVMAPQPMMVAGAGAGAAPMQQQQQQQMMMMQQQMLMMQQQQQQQMMMQQQQQQQQQQPSGYGSPAPGYGTPQASVI
jgi:hypothetical protein